MRAVVRSKGQLTLPAELRRKANLEEGDVVEFQLTDEGVLLKPKKLIDASQAWFWTPEWQERERQADEDIRAGRTTFFESDEAFLAHLDKLDRESR